MLPRDIRPATFASANLFSHPNWVAEIKHDGFRALAFIERGNVSLISKKGNTYTRFLPLCQELGQVFGRKELILDGEVCCLDSDGKSQFYSLMFRRGQPIFAAFDVLWSGGKDLRQLPLLMRKRILRKLIPQEHSHLLYVDYSEDVCGLFDLVCQNDLEGVVMKPKASVYANDRWVKILNPSYNQKEDRHKIFEKSR